MTENPTRPQHIRRAAAILAAGAFLVGALTACEASGAPTVTTLSRVPDADPALRMVSNEISWPTEVPATVIVSAKTPFDAPGDAQLWRAAQAQFAGAAPNRQLVVAENSSHEIPIDRPDVVIKAVDNLANKLG
jgi:pimeloyl-ACP methyl ester carboxylesterase